jgi:hypothetical protein
MSTLSARSLLYSRPPAASPHWNSPRSKGHSVQFYEEDPHLIEGLSQFIGSAILAGDSALVIAKRSHRDELFAHLSSRGLDLNLAMSEGHFLSFDAAETLTKFMVNGTPSSRPEELSSRPVGLHHQPLTAPYVKLSFHTALHSNQVASSRKQPLSGEIL